MKAAVIQGPVCEVYQRKYYGTVRTWVRDFKDSRRNVPGEERSGPPLLITDDLMQKINENVKENRCFTISSYNNKVPNEVPKVVYTLS